MPGDNMNTGAVRIQVSGNLVAFLIKEVVSNVSGFLEIWNWEQGPKHQVCSLSNMYSSSAEAVNSAL
jgi:hypothetical protein